MHLLDDIQQRNRIWLGKELAENRGSYLLGDTPFALLAYAADPAQPERADTLAALIEGNLANPARELLWGAPGTMLAALHAYEQSGHVRWAELFRRTARKLWSQLLWSEQHACHYFTQDMYGKQSTFLDGIHGFVATASPLIQGRSLLSPEEWSTWEGCIVNTVLRSSIREAQQVNWRCELFPRATSPLLLQFCHGAPGFVICLADLPSTALDETLLRAGDTIWAAGPLRKGANLCHGTGGNGYALLKLYQRTGNPLWLQRARAFATHALSQVDADTRRFGQHRYSLWTGDLGLAIYLWDCVEGTAAFPTLNTFFARQRHPR